MSQLTKEIAIHTYCRAWQQQWNGPAAGLAEMHNPPALIGGAVVPLGGVDPHYFSLSSQRALLTMPKPLTVWITTNCGKFLKELGIPDHLTCLLRNLYAGQEATVRTRCGTTDWFQIRKGVRQGCILSLCLFNLYAEYIMRNAGWMKHKLESRLSREISITSDMQMTPPLWQKVKKN